MYRVTIVPTKEVFRNEVPASVIWGCRVIGGDKIPKNKYNNISVTGKFALNLLLDEEYEVFLESTGNEKYPASYNIVGMVGFDYKEGRISVEPEVSYKALKKVTTSEKIANEILTHCPNFVEKVLNNEEGDIDYKPMHNVGPVRFAGYVRDIKSSYKSILLMSVFLEWNIPDNISARLDYPNKEKLVNALIENPYRVLIDEGSASFETADSIILEKDMSYAKSKNRCLYAILDILKGNEENGNTRINANTMVKVLRQVCPECSSNENILACVKESPYLHYDGKSKNVAIMATYVAEKTIADAIKSRLANNTPIPMAWENYKSVDGFEMTEEQAQILKNICDYNVNILTGGAGCVDAGTEFFNGYGWKRIADYEQGDKVLQYKDDGTAELVEPIAYIKQPCDKLWHFETPHSINQTVCEEHRILYKNKKSDIIRETNVLALKKISDENKSWNAGFITQFYHFGIGMNLSDEQIRLMVAVMAEGNFASKTTFCRVGLKKERKIKRFRMLLEQAKIEYKETIDKKDTTIFRFYAPERRKVYGDDWWNVNERQAKIICEEVVNWDGTTLKSRVNKLEKPCFRTTEKQSADYIQYIFTINGWQSTIVKYDKTAINSKWKALYMVSTKHGKLSSLCFDNRKDKTKTKFIQVPTIDGYKYCFTVPSHMLVLRRKDCIFITGNCGKSQSTRALIRMLEGHNKTYLLFSPTGIASKRLRDVTGRHAQTIHRFLAQRGALECDFDELRYRDKISADFVVIDEYTTCNIKVLARLITLLSDTTRIIFIGDNAQLASVGCGNLAEDLLVDNIIPTTRLTKVFRFGIGGIATVSTDVRNGKISEEKSYDDYKHIVSSDPLKDVLKEYQSLLDKGYTKDEIMILTPYNTSEIGTVHINSLIQDMVNPANGKKQEISFKGIRNLPITIREGDRVLNTKNNYHAPLWEQVDEKGNPLETTIANGDIGRVLQITKRGDTTVVVIQFDESIVYFDEDINKLLLAYCVSIHRVQGSQSNAVIVVLDICHKRLLSRNLLYVAYSRAQKYLVDICPNDVKDYALAIQENKQRDTWLKELLRGGD